MRKSVFKAATIILAIGSGIVCERGQAAEFIPCPLKKATIEVTSSLPKVWWSAPQLGYLKDWHTGVFKGVNTLVCDYEMNGRTVSVMREFPKGAANCWQEREGFMCNTSEQRRFNDQGRSENPSVYVSPIAPAAPSPLYRGGQEEGVQPAVPAAPVHQRPHGNLEDDQVLNPVGGD